MPASLRGLDETRARLDREVAEEVRGFPDTDIANAERLVARHGADIRYTVSAGWMVWDGQRWREDPKEVRIQALAKETARSIYYEIKTATNRDQAFRHAKRSESRLAIEAMVFLARSEPGVLTSITDFDSDSRLLNVQNGTIELRTGELREHHRQELITKMAPVTYDPNSKCGLWEAFLWRVTGQSEPLCEYLKRFVGYLLTGETNEQVLHFLYGMGANGKSVFVEIVSALLGDYAVIASPDLIMLKRHGGIPNDVACLRGARAVFMNETTQGAKFNEAKLKDLTGGDTLQARFLHREFFNFSPTHKLAIRGNHKPEILGTDDGIWRRLRLVPFTVSIPPEEQDRDLLTKLRAELPGVLKWAVDGCLDWQRTGLLPPDCILDAVKQYRAEADTLGRFIDECCDQRNLGRVSSSVFFGAYQKFCESDGERWISSKDLPGEMQRRGFIYGRGTGGKLRYLGIELRESGDRWEAK